MECENLGITVSRFSQNNRYLLGTKLPAACNEKIGL